MAIPTVSFVAIENNPITHDIDGRPAVSSKDVALRFHKKHKHILEEIRRIQSIVPKNFYEPNFRPTFKTVETPNGGTRKDPAFLLTRDGFSLLAMGFTGKAAIQWKLKYIEAFNALEARALDHALAMARTDMAAEGHKLAAQARAVAGATALDLSDLERARLKKLVRYRARGFSNRECALVMKISHWSLYHLRSRAKALGLEV